MTEAKTKTAFLERMRTSRAAYDAVLARVALTRMTEPMDAGGWTVKDIIAHITWHEKEMVEVLRARALVGSPLWERPTGERNAVIHSENRDRTLEDVMAEARDVYPQLLQAYEGITEEELVEPGRLKDMPPDWTLWDVLASNTFEHYDDHARDLEAWLGRTGRTPGA